MIFTPIKAEVLNGVGLITLNRGNALNALSLEMVKEIHGALTKWKTDPQVHLVVIQSSDPKAFSAGGDIKAVYDALKEGNHSFIETFYKTAYSLAPLIRTYPKPYVALVNGIAMGGGLGLAMHCPYRVVSEDARWAMPETHIGFFPDVGAGVFLKNCPGFMGPFIALTAYNMNTADAIYGKLATHYLPKDYFPIFLEALIRADTHQYASEIVGELLEHFTLPDMPMASILQENITLIEESRAVKTPLEFYEFWDKYPKGWARGVGQNLEYASPHSLAVTFHLFTKLMKNKSAAEILALEYPLSQKMIHHPDFQEGVRALLVDKTRHPHWTSSLETTEIADYLLD